MGFSNEPEVTRTDPTPAFVRPLQRQTAGFLENFLAGNVAIPGPSSPLQRQATGAIQQFLEQPSPEMQTLEMVQPELQGLLEGEAGNLPDFAGQAEAIIEASLPSFQRNLQTALGEASNVIGNPFSSALARAGTDITTQALEDQAFFEQQLRLSAQQQAAQQALEAQNLLQGGQLGAAELLGQFSQAAGTAPFNRLLQAGQFGAQLGQAAIDPTMQLLMATLGFASPNPIETTVGPSPLQNTLGAVGGIASSVLPFFL